MRKTIEIGDQSIEMASNALTPILYRQIFKQDFLKEISSLRRLKGKTAQTMTDEEISDSSDKIELFTKLAFVMAKQAELKTADKLVQLTQLDFYEWLTNFDNYSFQGSETMAQIISLWSGNAEDKKVESKNT